MPITITSKAAQEVLRVLEEQQLSTEETILRLGVNGSGCSGVSYSMSFTKKNEVNPLEDILYVFDGLNVAVERKAEAYLDGTTVDFYDSSDRRGFIFDNPVVKKMGMSSSSGGCGSCGGCGSKP